MRTTLDPDDTAVGMTQRLGFIGLGNMGGRMTRRLVDAGHDVLGYDVDPARAERVGARLAESIPHMTGESDVILLSLPDSTAVESVVRGPGGLLESGRAGQVILDLTTAAPRSTVALATELAAGDIRLIDAAISGGAAAAEKGTLTVMLGGDEKAAADFAWIFEPIASSVVPMGRVGAGHSMKVLNNFLNAMSLSATAEVMVAAKKAGLDLSLVLDVLNSSTGVNFATLNRFPSIIRGDYLEGGLTSSLMMKDLVLYIEHLKELGVPSLHASGPVAAFGAAQALGYSQLISNRVVDALGDLAGHVRLYEPADSNEEGHHP